MSDIQREGVPWMCGPLAVLLGGALGLLLVLGAGCATQRYSSDSGEQGPVAEEAAAELADWFERSCRLAHERADFEVDRADRTVWAGWATHSRNDFRGSHIANQLGIAFAVQVSLPWAPYEAPRGHYDHSEAEVAEHASGHYIPPVWVEYGAERQAVADWFRFECEMGDPYAVTLDYSAGPDRSPSAAVLIDEHALLETAAQPEIEDRRPARKRCDEGPCPAGTVFK